jgi:hypothetical protein
MSLFGWPFMALPPALADRILGRELSEAAILLPDDASVTAGGQGDSHLLVATGCGALLAAFTLAAFSSPRWQRPFLVAAVTPPRSDHAAWPWHKRWSG